jgi:hypothetical protein
MAMSIAVPPMPPEPYEAHDVADREHRGHGPAGGVDPQADVPLRVLGGEQHQLRAQPVAALLVQFGAEQQDPVAHELLGQGVVEGCGSAFVGHDPTLVPAPWPDKGVLPEADLLGAARGLRLRGRGPPQAEEGFPSGQ